LDFRRACFAPLLPLGHASAERVARKQQGSNEATADAFGSLAGHSFALDSTICTYA